MVEHAAALPIHLSAHVPQDSTAPSVNLKVPPICISSIIMSYSTLSCFNTDGSSDNIPRDTGTYVVGGLAALVFIIILVVVVLSVILMTVAWLKWKRRSECVTSQEETPLVV